MIKSMPSGESLWFNYDKLPKKIKQRWELDDVLELIFPKEFNPAQKDIASKLIKTMLNKPEGLSGEEIEEFRKANEISNATLRNLVIPKLVRIGLISRERDSPTGQTNKDKHHMMIIKLSESFGNALKKIGEEINSIINTNAK
jgi:hypothetical protein